MLVFSKSRHNPVTLSALLVVASVAAVYIAAIQLRMTPPAIAADNAESCMTTKHVNQDNNITAGGANGTSYMVEYRLYPNDVTQGPTNWKIPTESIADSEALGPISYFYKTALHDDSVYGLVEWRVVTSGHTGTDTTTLQPMVSIDDVTQSTITELSTTGPCSGSVIVNPGQWDWMLVPYKPAP
jgi:hypothetical protein